MSPASIDAVAALRRLPGLREADLPALRQLADQFEQVQLPDGEIVCVEGAPADTLYVLIEGAVQVRKRSDSGREHVVAELAAPCFFGHVGVLAVTDRTAGIHARGPITLLRMSARRARVIMRTGDFSIASPFRRALIVAMCQQLAQATAAVASLAVDANVAEEWREDDQGGDAEDSILPDDAEERLLKGLSQV